MATISGMYIINKNPVHTKDFKQGVSFTYVDSQGVITKCGAIECRSLSTQKLIDYTSIGEKGLHSAYNSASGWGSAGYTVLDFGPTAQNISSDFDTWVSTNCRKVETVPYAGLYDADNNLVASWDTLLQVYGLDVEKCYTLDSETSPTSYKDNKASGYSVLTKNPELAAGTKLILGDNVRIIGNYALADCDNLTHIVFPMGVWYIGTNAFLSCGSLQSVTTSIALDTIQHGAFFNCTNMTSISLHAALSDIGARAFKNPPLELVYYEGTKAQWQAITIKEDNEGLLGAAIVYNYGQFEPGEETPGKLPTAFVSYKGKILGTIAIGEYLILHTRGTKLESDIRVEACRI